MANLKAKLKLYMRLDASGQIIATSGVYRQAKPRVGRWILIPESNPCCTFTPAALVSIALTATPASIAVAGTSTLTAVGTYDDGSTKDITAETVFVSGTPANVTVSGNIGTGVAVGSSIITGTSVGIDGTTTITVA